MNVGKFMQLSESDKTNVSLKNVKTFCSLCGRKVTGESYCFGCHTFVCSRCDDVEYTKHICAGGR